jgi:hypothetical protein
MREVDTMRKKNSNIHTALHCCDSSYRCVIMMFARFIARIYHVFLILIWYQEGYDVSVYD